jgi:hypothetical protein
MRINQDHNTNNQDKYLLKIDPAFNYWRSRHLEFQTSKHQGRRSAGQPYLRLENLVLKNLIGSCAQHGEQ